MKARFVSTRVYDIKFDVSSVETSSKKPTLIDNTTLLNGIDDLSKFFQVMRQPFLFVYLQQTPI